MTTDEDGGRMIRGLYHRHVLPRLIDWGCGVEPVSDQRAKLLPRARGKVLEIGIGSGHNLGRYDPDKVERLWGVDPSAELLERARPRAGESGLAVELIEASAEELAGDGEGGSRSARGGDAVAGIPQGGVDTVVVTFTLCTLEDPVAALRGAARILRPGGELLFLEHGLAPDPGVRRWQDRLDPYWRRFAGGCHLNRPIDEIVRRAGFEIRELDRGYMEEGWRPANYLYRGVAVRPDGP